MRIVTKYFSSALLCVSAIALIALQLHLLGWILLLLGLLLIPFCPKDFAKDIFLLYISIAFLGLTPISTDISNTHILVMSTTLGLAVFLPYLISRFLYKDYLVRFRFNHGRSWHKTEIFYVLFTFTAGYLLLPYMLYWTGSYHNWTVIPGIRNLLILFLGTQALGLWDELFFISTSLGILRRYFPFHLANVFQAIIMASFLYELGVNFPRPYGRGISLFQTKFAPYLFSLDSQCIS